jgi:hypothetical protein
MQLASGPVWQLSEAVTAREALALPLEYCLLCTFLALLLEEHLCAGHLVYGGGGNVC